MLNHESPQEETEPSASHNRVTPDELARAVAAIEARKQAEADRVAGTIPIDEAVASLHLNATSDEIWAEVQAQRENLTARQRLDAQVEEFRRKQAPQTPPALAPLRARIAERNQRWSWPGRLWAALVLAGLLYATGIIPHHHTPTHLSASVLRPLAGVADGKEIGCDTAALIQLSEGKPLSQIMVDEGGVGSNEWKLVKIGGHVYLRGYIATTDSLQPLQGRALNVYNDDNSGELEGERTSNITLRVDKIPVQKSGGDDGFSEVTVPNFQPDPLTTLSPWH